MLTLKSMAEAVGAQYVGEGDLPLTGSAFDSRQVQAGDLFVALVGDKVDGHDFVEEAVAQGAKAVLVNRPIPDLAAVQIIAEDTVATYGDMARVWRSQFNLPVIGITGSCGKTSTKQMLSAILSECGDTLATQASFNSQVSLPYMVLKLRDHHKFAIFEMGTNAPGQIARLAEIAQPTVALITNVSLQHYEGLGDCNHIAAEKGAIYQALGKHGIGIINSDEPFADSWLNLLDTSHKVTFSKHQVADITASHSHLGPDGVSFDLATPIGQQAVAVPLPGEHVVANALAAAAAAMAVGADLQAVACGLAKVKPTKGRFCPHRLANGATIVDDSFNASPRSVETAVATLAQHDGNRILVLSNMAELAEQSEDCHRKIAQQIAKQGINHVLLYGDKQLLAPLLDELEHAQWFATKSELTQYLLSLIDEHTMVVVKGARSCAMEEVVNLVLASEEDLGC